MKILVISPKFHPVIGGGETYVLNSVARLHKAGLEVAIAVEPHPDRILKDYPFPVYEVEGLSDSSLDIIKGTANLHTLLLDYQPDILHIHGYFALLATGLADTHNLPIITSIHSTPVWGERIIGGMNSFDAELQFTRKVLDLAQPKVVTAANDVYATAASKIVQGKFPVAVTPYPVDTNFFFKQHNPGLRSTFGLNDADTLILVPSRIIERKGIKEAVFALAELPDTYHLLLPGAFDSLDGNFWQSVVSTPTYTKVKDRIIIPKRKVLYNDMPGLYGACDIVAMPSYYEGAPVATVEAMASEKPFVGADSQGINGFIRHQTNGLLVPQKNAEQLAAAILRVSQDPHLGRQLAAQARQDIMRLSWDVQLSDLIDLYRTTLSNDKKEPLPRLFAEAGL